MFTVLWPGWLVLLPLPILIYRYLAPAPKVDTALRVPFFDFISHITGSDNASSDRYAKVLLSTVWILIVLAAVRPQWIGDTITVPVSGRDLMLAVDISGSMETRDMDYRGIVENRLDTVKRVAGAFIRQRIGDRVGLILFGTRAYLQSPLTLDRVTVEQLLDESAIGIAGEKTALGDAIGLAIKRLKARSGDEKTLILLTDGANTAGAIGPVQAADLAASIGLRIHTIGIGADKMMIQGFVGQRRVNPSADLDEQTLSAIAHKTGGRYFRANDSQSLRQIYDLIDQLEPVDRETQHLRPVKELYFYPLGAAWVLSVLLALTRLYGTSLLADRSPTASRSS